MNNLFIAEVAPPLIAILRGLTVANAAPVGRVLYAAGFRLLEVPLNRDGAVEAMAELIAAVPRDALIGAGTVTTTAQVDAVADAGGRMIISANTDRAVIASTRRRGLWSVPGAATPSEAFAAVKAGAHALKAFPAEAIPPAALRAWRSVLPPELAIYPVGGIDASSMGAYRAAGASGFGLGGALFTPALAIEEVERRAIALVAAWKSSE